MQRNSRFRNHVNPVKERGRRIMKPTLGNFDLEHKGLIQSNYCNLLKKLISRKKKKANKEDVKTGQWGKSEKSVSFVDPSLVIFLPVKGKEEYSNRPGPVPAHPINVNDFESQFNNNNNNRNPIHQRPHFQQPQPQFNFRNNNIRGYPNPQQHHQHHQHHQQQSFRNPNNFYQNYQYPPNQNPQYFNYQNPPPYGAPIPSYQVGIYEGNQHDPYIQHQQNLNQQQ